MRGQWGIIIGLIVALIISVFAVINVDSVRVNYLFGEANWPLILIILGSVLMGALIVGAFGMVKIYQLQTEIKKLKKSQTTVHENVHNHTEHKSQVAEKKDEELKPQENKINK